MRYPDWSQRLNTTIKAALERPFSWGKNDCCTFMADCCVAVCGVDPAEQYRGAYCSRLGAFRQLRKRHGSIDGALDACFSRISLPFAQRGDVVVFSSPDGPCSGVLWAQSIWAATEGGIARTDAQPTACWRVE
ncbi:DUF6950 family protein [Carnimonas bestiolae]|uniref:DUF6950 family protein n=1 Tax=Carnimonas bestiolae TaxID=3402172 RepID=UPI003EDBE846